MTVWDHSGGGPRGSEPIVLRTRQAAIVSSLAFRPGSRRLAAGDQSGALTLWHLGEFPERLEGCDLGAEVALLDWRPDGNRLAAGTSGGDVFVLVAPGQ